MASNETITEVEEKLDDITKCYICNETFNEPKILPCFHTFCLNCLQQAGAMTCPICRKEFRIPKTGYDGLKRNLLMERLAEIKQIIDPSSVCDECFVLSKSESVDRIPVAEAFCTDCRRKLCNGCHCRHTKIQHHKVIGLEEVAAQKNTCSYLQNFCLPFCEEHKKKSLRYYCDDCKKVACSVCSTKYHKGHQRSDVNKIANELRQKIQIHVESLSSLATNYVDEKNDLEESYATFVRKVQETEDKVNKKRNQLKELVDKHADSLFQELQSLRQTRLEEHETNKDKIWTQYFRFDGYRTHCRQIEAVGSAVDVCREVNNLLRRGKNLPMMIEPKSSGSVSVSLRKTNASNLLRTTSNVIGKLQVTATTTDKTSHDHGIEFKCALKQPADARHCCITGIAILENELFVSYLKTGIEVFDMQTLEFKRECPVKSVNALRVNDMKQCCTQMCIYIMKLEYKKDVYNEIIKIDRVGGEMKRWSVGGRGQLSVTWESNILFTPFYNHSSSTLDGELEEYTPAGCLVRTIPLRIGFGKPWHAIKLPFDHHYAVSHEVSLDLGHRVSIVDKEGFVSQCVIDYLKCPLYLDIYRDGNILVADFDNSRVLLLSYEFKLSTIPFYHDKPKKVLFDQPSGRVLVVATKIDKKSKRDEVQFFSLAELSE